LSGRIQWFDAPPVGPASIGCATFSEVRVSYSRLFGLLLVWNGAIVAVFGGWLWLRPHAVADEPAARPLPTGAWADVDAVSLGREVGELVLGAKRHLLTHKRVELSEPEVVGNDVVVRVALRRPKGGVGAVYPGTLYCSDCEREACQFERSTRTALEALARSVPADSLRKLAGRVGRGRLAVTFGAAAVDERIEPTEDEKTCVGSNYKTFQRALGHDVYRNACGTHACTVGTQPMRVGPGDIDDPRKLACLRAFCLHKGSSVAEVDEAAYDLRFAGRVGDDGAATPADVAIALRDLGAPANAEAHKAFLLGYRDVVGEEGGK
jgi:hypothetical protein